MKPTGDHMTRAIKLSTGRANQDSRWLVYLDCPPEWGFTCRRSYVYALTEAEAIQRAKNLTMPIHLKQYLEKQ